MCALYHPCTSLYDCCRAVKVPFFLPMKVKGGAGPYPQPERGQSISPTGKGPVHIPNRKGAMQKAWIRAPYQNWPKRCTARARCTDAPPRALGPACGGGSANSRGENLPTRWSPAQTSRLSRASPRLMLQARIAGQHKCQRHHEVETSRANRHRWGMVKKRCPARARRLPSAPILPPSMPTAPQKLPLKRNFKCLDRTHGKHHPILHSVPSAH